MNDVIRVVKCPICNKVEQKGKYSPFCSKRCADVDLGKWLNESYSIPTNETSISPEISEDL